MIVDCKLDREKPTECVSNHGLGKLMRKGDTCAYENDVRDMMRSTMSHFVSGLVLMHLK